VNARVAVSFFIGLTFGLGLIVSGMVDPSKVIGFLDVAGRWDPSLAFVMGGAIAVAAPVFALVERRGKSLRGAPLSLASRRTIDARLVIGSALFGAGWGLAGLCPGPAIVALGHGQLGAAVFVAAMVAGMLGAQALDRARPHPARPG
jgi:uncharacterized membrane protein YedE/YeeE